MLSVKVLLIALVYLNFAYAFNLKCEFQNVTNLYCCEAKYLSIEEPQTKITNVIGTHLPNLGTADVEFLKILEQKDVKYLPINIAEYFPNLKRFVVKNTRLRYITQENLQGLTQLTVLYLTSNKLRELPCGLLNNNRKLQEIHFENNTLAKIGADVFRPLSHLSMVHFRLNNCINRDVNETSGVAELLKETITKCYMDCGEVPIASSCNSKYSNIMFKQLILLFIILIIKR